MRQRSIALILLATGLFLSVLMVNVTAQKVKVAGTVVTNTTIQAAVDLAVNGDSILISVGTFAEAVMVSNKNLNLLGGWNENLDTPLGTPSIIDGANSYRPLTFLSSSSTVHSLNLYDGGGGLANSWGGGLQIGRTSWVQVASTIIEENESGWAGGGVYVAADSHARLIGCSVFNNKAKALWGTLYGGSFGGGVFVAGSAEVLGATTISQNTATNGYGGGIWVNIGSLTVSNSHIWGNEARAGATIPFCHGGGIGAVNSRVEVEDTDIEDNVASSYGGGMALSGCTTLVGQARYVNFNRNSAADGGGLYLTNSLAELRRVEFYQNTAVTNGGGIGMEFSQLRYDGYLAGLNYNEAGVRGGGVYMIESTASFDTVFFGCDGYGGNWARYGGGIDTMFSMLTISGGCFSGNCATGGWTSVGGGAIRQLGGSVTITNGSGGMGVYSNYVRTIFSGNRAILTNGYGGALYCFGELNVHDAAFESNSAMEGGAAYLSGTLPNRFLMTSFAKNYAEERGGAIRCYSGTVYAVDTDLSENDTGLSGDGGALSMSGGRLDAYNCRFLNNTSDYGGAIAAWDATLGIKGSGYPFDWYHRPYNPSNGYASCFQGNYASAIGGALYSWGNTVTVYYTAFVANRAPVLSGAHLSDLGSDIQIHGSLLVDAPSGDAVSLFATPKCNFRLSTIANNAGAGVRLEGNADVGISNSIVWDGGDTIVQTLGSYSLGYSDVEGYGGGSVISTNPHFLPNYHLRQMSPCINAGEPMILPGPVYRIVYDIDGEAPVGANNDMGFDQFVDTDGDSLPDVIETGTGVWRSEIDTGSDPTLVHSDGDGVDDGAEWIASTDPSDAGSVFEFTRIWHDSGNVHIEWTSGTNTIIQDVHSGAAWVGSGFWATTLYFAGGTSTNEDFSGANDSGFFYISMER